MTNNDTGLVLNIDTPDFFQRVTHHTGVKRSIQQPFASISSKKFRLSKPTGKVFKKSTKNSKLKIGSAIKLINENKLSNKRNETTISSENIADKLSEKSKSQKRVSFNSNVEITSLIDDISDGNANYSLKNNPQLSDTKFKTTSKFNKTNSSSKQSKQPVHSNSQNKPISSLFKKNPEVPILKKSSQNLSKDGDSPETTNLFTNFAFSHYDIAPEIVSALERLNHTKMTVVQHKSIPVVFSGKDALIKSETGSGKTLAYALPIVQTLMKIEPKIDRKQGLFALIVVPSRELAVQTYQWMVKLCKCCVWVVPGYTIGGEKKKTEKARLRKGVNVLISTPGRLIDHINNTCSLSFRNLRFFVLDEADRMLDMGYEQNIKSILYALNEDELSREKKQTILLSATLTSDVQKLAGITLKSPEVIDVTSSGSGTGETEPDATTGSGEDGLSARRLTLPKNLRNFYALVPTKLRLVTLAAFIVDKCKFSCERKMLVFMNTQDMVDYHTSLFALILAKLGQPKRPRKEEVAAERVFAKSLAKDHGEDDDDYESDQGSDLDEDNPDQIQFMKLHGNMPQSERTAVFKSFHDASSGVLLSTDVAARGLDLPHCDWVVQYNPTFDPSDFVHRAGRTARAERHGSAVVFLTPSEAGFVAGLENMGVRFSELRMTDILDKLTNKSLYDADTEKIPARMEVAATRLQDKLENAVEADVSMKDLSVQGYTSFLRSYAAIPKKAREYFDFKQLHLGHCAKSFALKDPPAVLGAYGAKKSNAKKFRANEEANSGLRSEKSRQPRRSLQFQQRKTLSGKNEISEFDAGVDFAKMGRSKTPKKSSSGKRGKSKKGKPLKRLNWKNKR